jgi:hypothetical protein
MGMGKEKGRKSGAFIVGMPFAYIISSARILARFYNIIFTAGAQQGV